MARKRKNFLPTSLFIEITYLYYSGIYEFMSKKILIDRETVQVRAHLDKLFKDYRGNLHENPEGVYFRLKTFLNIVKKFGQIFFSDGEITTPKLSNIDLYVILTRIQKYKDSELHAIHSFVEKGGNVLLMANHGPTIEFNQDLANKFGIILAGSYWSGKYGKFTHLLENNLTNHPIISDISANSDCIKELVINSSCGIVPSIGDVIAWLPDSISSVGDYQDDLDNTGKKIFALSLDASHIPDIRGKIVLLADSGFVGEKDSKFPGFGLIDKGDNLLFIDRILKYLT